MADLTVPQGDYGHTLSITIQNSAGVAYNLTGYTIYLRAWKAGIPGIMFNKEATITVAADGTCYYNVVAGDFPNAGYYELKAVLTKAGAKESSRTYDLEVEESL